MKKIFAVALLLLSFASAAMADGGMLPPPSQPANPLKAGVVQLSDGGMLPPPPSKPIEGMIAA
jgi:hypothetical protein